MGTGAAAVAAFFDFAFFPCSPVEVMWDKSRNYGFRMGGAFSASPGRRLIGDAPPATDIQRLAGDITGLVRKKKRHGIDGLTEARMALLRKELFKA